MCIRIVEKKWLRTSSGSLQMYPRNKIDKYAKTESQKTSGILCYSFLKNAKTHKDVPKLRRTRIILLVSLVVIFYLL